MTCLSEDILSAQLSLTLSCENIELAILSNIKSRGEFSYELIVAVKSKIFSTPEIYYSIQKFFTNANESMVILSVEETNESHINVDTMWLDFQISIQEILNLVRKRFGLTHPFIPTELISGKWYFPFEIYPNSITIGANHMDSRINQIITEFINSENDYLDLSNLNLENIPTEIFRIKGIKKLNLSTNNIMVIEDRIQELTELEYLNLSNNQIEYLPNEINELKALVSLHLDSNTLFELPDELCELENLQILTINDTLLNNLPKQIGKLKSLKKLEIKSKFICEIPDSIGELKNLQELKIEATSIHTLPNTINKLSNLEVLEVISNKKLNTLPESLGNLKNLKTLYLYDNEIKTLPVSIGELNNLVRLYLNDNRIEELPPEITLLENLKYLNLSNNRLKHLPFDIFEMNSLEYLNIKGNYIDNELLFDMLVVSPLREKINLIN